MADIYDANVYVPGRKVRGFCPVCGSGELYLDVDGYIECNGDDCPNYRSISWLLQDNEWEHVVRFGSETYFVRHPLRERISDDFMDCLVLDQLRDIGEMPPEGPGDYRVTKVDDEATGLWHFHFERL